MKITILDGFCANPGDLSWESIAMLGELTVYDRVAYIDSEIQKAIGDSEAIFTNKTPVSRATLEACPSVKFVGVLATGYNVVDVAAAKELGVLVCNIPAYSTPAVAQHAISLLLELCLHVGSHSQAVCDGRWQNGADWCFWNYPLVELHGKTMGIVGYGRIGSAVAGIAAALGMKVLACASKPRTGGGGATEFVTLDELLSASDVISLHCPLTAENAELVRAESIAKMKDGVLLINTARGGLINEPDLLAALTSGKVGGAGLDVLSTEPPRQGNVLIGAPNCILTPHIAWASKESRQRLMDIAAANLKAYMEGAPINVVNL